MVTPNPKSLELFRSLQHQFEVNTRMPTRIPDKGEWKRARLMVETIEAAWGDIPPPSSPSCFDILTRGGSGPFAVHSENCRRRDELRGFYRERLGGKTLFDLAAGGTLSYLTMVEFAFLAGAKEYVAIDRYQDFSQADVSLAREYLNTKYGKDNVNMQIHFVKADMLLFLAHEANASANVSMSGFDEACLPPALFTDMGYVHELVMQIARVTEPSGLTFGINNPFLRNLSYHGFIDIGHIPGYGRLRSGRDVTILANER